ncbi:uracil-DNA glycosylase [Candidatus Azambacteria bacterium]|nr:uracil-DNA glycosylase [Candidatus Azambacteria bacterium]MBI3685409.1 uracil-DNA glycosylase [Candidatus Azambacteria bacterium]
MSSKAEALEKLKQEMEADHLPLKGEANLVFGEGSMDADVMFIGEAPGFHEDKLVRPFVGQAGKLLDKLLIMVGWPRERVYITNIVKRRPPENRDPLPEELDAYTPYLTRQIKLINPKMIVTLGRFSMNYFLPLAKISRDKGRAVNIDGYVVVPVYHPAAALRSGAMMKELENDFRKLPRLLADFSVVSDKKPEKETKQPAQAALF